LRRQVSIVDVHLARRFTLIRTNQYYLKLTAITYCYNSRRRTLIKDRYATAIDGKPGQQDTKKMDLQSLLKMAYPKQRNFVQANVHQYPGKNTKMCDLQPGSTELF